jgi:two-component system, NarL family, sensor histidine kinase UhpB
MPKGMNGFSARSWPTLVFFGAGLLLIAFGLAALFAWHFEGGFASFHLFPLLPVSYGTAFGFLFCGVAMAAITTGARAIVQSCAGLVIMLGAIRVFYYVAQVDFSLPLPFVSPELANAPANPAIMGPLSALSFVLAASSLAVLSVSPRTAIRSAFGALLASGVIALSLISLLGYLNENRFVYEWLEFAGDELPTFVGFLVLGGAALALVFGGRGDGEIAVRKWAPIAIWFGVFLGTLVLWQALNAHEYREIARTVRFTAEGIAGEIETAVKLRAATMKRLALRLIDYQATREQWEEDAFRVFSDYTGTAAIYFADKQFEIRWAVPADATSVLGIDLSADETRRQALRDALTKREVALSGFIDLIVGGKGFKILAPVYEKDGAFAGVIAGAYRIGPLLEAVVKDIHPGFSVALYQEGKQIYALRPEDEKPIALSEHVIALHGAAWTVRVAPTPGFAREFHSGLAEATLASGLLLATLLALAIYFYQSARARGKEIETINLDLRREAEERVSAQQALAESEKRNRLILRVVKDYAMFMIDARGMILNWNRGAAEITGYSEEQAVGKHFSMLYYREKASEDGAPEQALRTALQAGRWRDEGWRLKRDGSRFCAEEVITPIHDEAGELQGYSIIMHDLTERRALEERLTASRDFYMRLFGDFPNPVWRTDSNGKGDYFNRAWLDFTGRTLEQELAADWADGLHPDDAEFCLSVYREAFAARRPFEMEYRLRRADGNYAWIYEVGKPYRDLDGTFRGYIGSCYLTDDRRRMEIALQESTARYKAMTANVPGVVLQLLRKPDGGYSFPYLSSGVIALTKLKPDTIVADAQVFLSLIPEEDLKGLETKLEISARDSSRFVWSGRIRLADETTKWIGMRASPSPLPGGEVIWDGVLYDETEEKKAQFEIERSREQLAALSGHLQLVREEEKAKVAREIHDELGGKLAAIKMGAVWLSGKVPQNQPALAAKANEMAGLADSAVSAVRRIMAALRPTVLDDLGLAAALQWEAREFRKRFGIECHVETNPDELAVPNDVALALFRIFQEALDNAARHAEAKRVSASLCEVDTAYVMRIADDGVGISEAEISTPASHGVRGMLERAHKLKGQATIVGVPGRGTMLTVAIPKSRSG